MLTNIYRKSCYSNQSINQDHAIAMWLYPLIKSKYMNKINVKYAVGLLLIGVLIGGYAFKTNFMLVNDHAITTEKETMKETTLEIPKNVAKPTVQLEVIKDAIKGYNIHVETTNFVFTPEKVNQKDIIGEGHAHLYVDGTKITRLYGNWYYLGAIAEGKHKVSVSLNGNSHAQYMVNGVKIEDVVEVTVDRAISGTPAAHQD